MKHLVKPLVRNTLRYFNTGANCLNVIYTLNRAKYLLL